MKQTNAILACLLAVFFLAVKTSSAAKPNFIIIFADDQGYGDLSCFGSKTIRTPNIDKLAAGGIKYTQMYNSARCCPTRAALPEKVRPLFTHIVGRCVERTDWQ